MRLIDADALKSDIFFAEELPAITSVILLSDVLSAPTVTANIAEWVSVEDRLPENDESLHFYEDSDMKFVSVLACGYFLTNGGSKRVSVKEVNRVLVHKTGNEYPDKRFDSLGAWSWGKSFDVVTHWMPLPEPAAPPHKIKVG